MLRPATLTGLPALFYGRGSRTEATIEEVWGHALRLSLADVPAPSTEVRVALVSDDKPLGTVQFQGIITSAYRAEGQIHVVVELKRVFAPTDDVFLVSFLRQYFDAERVQGKRFRNTSAGTVYEFPPPEEVKPPLRPPPVDEEEEPEVEQEAELEAAAIAPGTVAVDRTPSRQLVSGTAPVRIPLIAHLDGIPFRGRLVYRASEEGMRLFVCSLGRPPGYGAAVVLDVDVPAPEEGHHTLHLHGAVSWSAGPDETSATTSYSLRIGPGTSREHMAEWAEALSRAIAVWKERRKGGELLDRAGGRPPRDVVERLEALVGS